MVEINAAYIRNQIAKLAFQNPGGDDGVVQVFPGPVGPDVIEDCCETPPPEDVLLRHEDRTCLGMFISIWETLIPYCIVPWHPWQGDPALEEFWRERGYWRERGQKPPPLSDKDLRLTPADEREYNDPNSDFPLTVPVELDFAGCGIPIDSFIRCMRHPTMVPEGSHPCGPILLHGTRAQRRAKLQEIMECFHQFYQAAADEFENGGLLTWRGRPRQYPLSRHNSIWPADRNPCCSVPNIRYMMMMLRLISCLSTIRQGPDFGGFPYNPNWDFPLFSDQLRQRMIQCITCIDKKCRAEYGERA